MRDVSSTSKMNDKGPILSLADFSRLNDAPRPQSIISRFVTNMFLNSPPEPSSSRPQTFDSIMRKAAADRIHRAFHGQQPLQRSQEHQPTLLAEHNTQDQAVQTDPETLRRSDSQTRGPETGGDRHKEPNDLQQTLDRTIDNLMPSFREYVKKTEYMLKQLPGMIEYLQLPGVIEQLQEGSIKEIKLELKLKLDNKQWKDLKIDEPALFMFWMDGYEKSERITHAPIPDKIKHLEECLKKRQKETPSEKIDFYGTEQKFLHKHIRYLTLQQENLQKQSKELDKELGKEAHKYKDKRKELINLKDRRELQNDLKKVKEEYLSFLREQSLSPTIEQHILERVSQNYRTEGIGIEQLILDRTTNLAELASETIFDTKIEELQNLQKSAAKHLNSEDYENYESSSFFLKSQKHKTDYYLSRPNLVWIQQMRGRGCGFIATLTAAADKDQSYMVPDADRDEGLLMTAPTAPVVRYTRTTINIYDYRLHHNPNALDIGIYKHSYGYRSHHALDVIALDRQAILDSNKDSLGKKRQAVEGVIKEFDRLSPPELGLGRGTTNGIMYHIVLKRIGHPIEYDYFNNENISHNKWDTRNIMLPPYLCEEAFASTGRPLQNITADQLKKAIENEEREKAENTIITPLIKKHADKSFVGHVILIDAIEIRDGEEHIVYRDPHFGAGGSVSWNDFLECWSGEAIIPRGIVEKQALR